MAKKAKAVYAPGELDRVRGKLGNIDNAEAKRVAQILGGEVGYERSQIPESGKPKRRSRNETVELVVGGKGGRGRRPSRRIDISGGMDDGDTVLSQVLDNEKPEDPADDPSVQLKTSYFERVKMDRYAAQPEFDIKNSAQVLVSVFSFFSEPPDYVNPRFVTRRMNDYYQKIEQLVASTRTLFPRNNIKRNDRMKKTSPFVYSILDAIRYWNIERIDSDMAKIQAHPRTARIAEFADILRAVYKPLFILEQLDMEAHIKNSYKLLYKILYIESPMNAKEKYQGLIRTALAALADIRRDVGFCLYPLLMKLVSDRWLPYERFFIDRRRRYMSFLGVTSQEQIAAVDMNAQQVEGDIETLQADAEEQEQTNTEAAGSAEAPENPETAKPAEPEEDISEPEAAARKAQEAAKEFDRKALDRGRTALEALFPKAGWENIEDFPDLYPYFADTYTLKKGYELIAPADPLQQIAILMHILEDLFFGLRYVRFGSITGSDGNLVDVENYLGDIINNWRRYLDDSFIKEYLPRLVEYCRILENASESRTSVYAKKIVNELHWVKRLYFLPYYKFESLGPPPFQKQDASPVYTQIRQLRKYLTSVAVGIEQGTRQGGAETRAACDGINNPWEPYNFEVPNPISRRLDMMLAPKKRNNASLIFFSLAAATVLDYLVNNESSWAYGPRPGPLFRSINNEGITPMFGVEKKYDAEQIFKEALKRREQRSKP
ncbi:MAG: hypothetical protein LBD48_13815 [Treponema sp.]|jgi:hypothetical protein|nr:hypothetical protein [Treponema sp.]